MNELKSISNEMIISNIDNKKKMLFLQNSALLIYFLYNAVTITLQTSLCLINGIHVQASQLLTL